MKMPHIRSILAAMIAAAVATSATLPAHASNFTITSSTSGSTTKFIVTRNDATTDETVNYRTVSLSAYAGQHFTSASGTLTFPAGQTAVTNFVSERTPSADAYKFQTGSNRSYRFELTDAGGFPLNVYATRDIATGTSVPSSGAFNVKDLTIQYAEYTADDRGYDSNGYKSVSSNGYFSAAAPKAYFQHVNAQLRMTLSMQAKENDDAYEYLQLLFDNTSTCDNRSGASNGDPGTPSLSSYMAGFEMDTDGKDDSYKTYTFPVTNVANNAGATNPWGYSSTGKYPLYKQKFNTTTSSRAADGRIVVPMNFSSIVLRLNASGGSGSDEWAAKYVKAHVQAVDSAAPTKLGISAAPGIHARGNDFYVSVAFSEPVTCSSATLTNSWGTLNYNSGSGSNVLTFKGTIGANASGSLNITGWSGTIKDLAGNPFGGSLNQSGLASFDVSHAYTISYDLAGGSASNPTSYTYDSNAITLANPVRTGYTFAGWSGTGFSGTRTTVTIAAHSHGDRAYTAHWTLATYTITYANATNGVDGVVNANPTSYTIEDGTVSLTDPTRTNYFFCGWYENPGFTGDSVSSFSAADLGDRTFYAKWTTLPPVPYIDENGVEQQCRAYTVITNAAGNVAYGERGAEAWYVVTNDVTISGRLYFDDDYAHLILCDGATLTVTNENGEAIKARVLTINGQTNGTGAIVATGIGQFHFNFSGIDTDFVIINGGIVTATGSDYGIYTGFVTINGGSVTATGGYDGIYVDYDYASVAINGGSVTATGGEYGIYVRNGSITLGWTNPTDSIYASSYYGTVRVKSGKLLTDGSNTYSVVDNPIDPNAIAGKTLIPAIPYVDANGGRRYCTGFTILTNAVGSVVYGESGAENWYVVTNDVSIVGMLQFNGATNHLIVCNGAALTVTNMSGDAIFTGGNLAIYGQSGGTGTLTAYGDGYGIYAEEGVTTNGVGITATGGDGGGDDGIKAGDSLTINGGTVTATGHTSGIHGHGTVTINGGTVTATGGRYGIDAGDSVTITGGSVTATATRENSDGIHAGDSVTITGGSVTATGDYGIYADGSSVTINGSSVTINGGSVTATGDYGIYAGISSVTINGGSVTATSTNEYGTGIYARSKITLGWTNPTDSIYASSYSGQVRVTNGKRLTDGSNTYSYSAGDNSIDPNAIAGKTLRPYLGIPYIDANGVEQHCTSFTVITNAAGDVGYGGGGENWYVVTTNVTVSGILLFADDTAHLILCDGATLSVTNVNGTAIDANDLAIYCQTNGTGAVAATGGDDGNGINATGTVTINGGNVTATATGDRVTGIYADRGIVTINGGTVTATGDISGIAATGDIGIVTINGGSVTATGGNYGIYAYKSMTINDGSVTATATREYGAGIWADTGTVTINGGNVSATGEGYGIHASGDITLGWTNPADSVYASSYAGHVIVKSKQMLTDGYGGIYEGDNIDPDDIAGKTLWPGFKDPEGAVINDPAIIEWLAENGFRQSDINRLGNDNAATEKLYECYLINCDFKVQGAGGALSITGIAVSNGVVSVGVQFVRTAPLGFINGVLNFYGTEDLAAGFGYYPIAGESIDFGEDDPSFDTAPTAGTVTQSVTATFDVNVVSDKFFKAEIGVENHYEPEPEYPWDDPSGDPGGDPGDDPDDPGGDPDE